MRDKILIIDDDPRNIFALVAVLKANKYHCVTSVSAIAGISLLLNQDDIGIVLLDMMMPEMDGYQAIAEIKNNKQISEVPVIAVTAQAMMGDREKCLEAGADAYLSKPIDIDALLKVLEHYMKRDVRV
ncbi:response regulator [Arcticibacter eurypsychrophilus]|uniref:response regulator n=1 Tax=Arcticibacter eurypsychrophilus TaxID=1434752 RepID=UPI00084D3135|nr:response regulator [Arcticibacter eurypsychrophilus]